MLARTNRVPWYVSTTDAASMAGALERFAEHIGSFFPEEDRGRLKISTTHKYKGLESPAVIILDADSYPLVTPTGYSCGRSATAWRGSRTRGRPALLRRTHTVRALPRDPERKQQTREPLPKRHPRADVDRGRCLVGDPATTLTRRTAARDQGASSVRSRVA